MIGESSLFVQLESQNDCDFCAIAMIWIGLVGYPRFFANHDMKLNAVYNLAETMMQGILLNQVRQTKNTYRDLHTN